MKKIMITLFSICLLTVAFTGCSKPVTQAPNGTDAAAGEQQVIYSYTVEVTDDKGNKTLLPVQTSEANLGKALLQAGIIAGEQGQYGLYVKTVNGITADAEKDGVYWSVSKDGELLLMGVDSVTVENGATYQFVYTVM